MNLNKPGRRRKSTIFLFCTIIIHSSISVVTSKDESTELFFQLFLAKRMEQLQAVKNILTLDMDKQKKFLDQVTGKMQEVMSRNRIKIENAGFIPEQEFPTDAMLRDSLSLLLENSCLFCDIALRIPDEIDRRLRASKELNLTLRWAVGYVKDLKMLDASTSKLLNLCAQEINLIDKTADYHNPYRIERAAQKRFEDPPTPRKKERKKLKRGPKMSHAEL